MLVTILVYLPAMGGGFIFDDDRNVTANQLLGTPEGLKKIWLDPHASYQYYPLTYTCFWIEYHLWGTDPAGYHVVNVLLHGVNAFLVGLLLARLAVPGAWLAALLFAVHPVHVQSVAWVTELKNVLSGFFFLIAFLVFLRFLRGGEHRGRFYALSFLMFLCALLSKTATVALPVALLLVLWWKQGRIKRQDALALAPFFLAGVALGWLTAWLEVHDGGAQGPEWQLSLVERCLMAGRVLWFYADKLVLPYPLMFVYPRWHIDTAAWWQYLFPCGAVVVMLFLWSRRARFGRGPLAAVLFVASMLVPTPAFINIGFMRFSYVADHWLYLPSIALLALAAACVENLLRPGPVRTGGMAITVAVLSLLSWQHAKVFHDQETLFRDNLVYNLRSWLAHNNLGNALVEHGKLTEAIGQYEEAARLKPDAAEPHNNWGLVLFQRGESTDAAKQYEEALRIKPNYFEARYNLGIVLFQLGRVTETAEQFDRAVQLKPDSAKARSSLGLALLQLGKVAEAKQQCEEALRIAPDMTEAHYNLGNILLRLGDLTGAIGHYERALQRQPDYAEAHNNLGLALFQLGKVTQAKEQFEEAVRLKPDYALARDNLAKLQALQQTNVPGN